MHRRQSADDRKIFDGHMTGKRRNIRHDDAISERAIMCDVAICENRVVRANARGFSIAGRAVNRDVFAEGVAVADFRARDSAAPFQILRLQPDAREWKNFVFASEFRMAVNDHMRMQFAFVAENHIFANHAIRSDFAIFSNLRFGMNDCSRMKHNYSPRSMKVTSASLTISSSTLQTPLALPSLPRIFIISTSTTRTSPGKTGLRHFTSFAAMKYAICPAFSACRSMRIPAVCAMVSSCSTPGMMG